MNTIHIANIHNIPMIDSQITFETLKRRLTKDELALN